MPAVGVAFMPAATHMSATRTGKVKGLKRVFLYQYKQLNNKPCKNAKQKSIHFFHFGHFLKNPKMSILQKLNKVFKLVNFFVTNYFTTTQQHIMVWRIKTSKRGILQPRKIP